jgi:hypothetical protein
VESDSLQISENAKEGIGIDFLTGRIAWGILSEV